VQEKTIEEWGRWERGVGHLGGGKCITRIWEKENSRGERLAL